MFDCADGGAARQEVHHRHLPEAVALLQDFEEVFLSAPRFQYATLPASTTNIESAWSCSRKKNSFAGTDTTGHKSSKNRRTSAPMPPKTGMRCRSLILATCIAILPELQL
jgi:hypothetical protein